ncbi:MAG: sugar phosphate isomerase/epimerase family protein [bacterium]|jgi:sugar phosphate isomerase/epimerase
MERRNFLKTTGSALFASGALMGTAGNSEAEVKGEFEISVAAWSWHRMMRKGEIQMIDQPRLAREAGATGVELVNQLFPVPLYRYLKELNKAADDAGVKILLLMVDGEGSMYSPDFRERKQAVINHRKWLDIAAVLGCHSIRCNAGEGQVEPREALRAAADSFSELSTYARQYNMNVIIENHGGLSSDPEWLVALMKAVDMDNFGTLPDFGNFPRNREGYTIDIYDAVRAMMPYAKAVSAKCYDFDENGNETTIDYEKMMQIVLEAGYNGYVGVEYEGNRLSEPEGIKACVNLLQRFQK